MAIHFTTVAWARGANVYEVNLRQYTTEGNFTAFIQHLPRLQQMGVQILWFMPLTPIGVVKRLGSLGSYYACSNYTAINPEFGTISSFKELVQEAHKLGLKIIIDWVANHTAWDHHWTITQPNWYKKDALGNFTEENGWEDVIDLDYTVPALRLEMITAMQWWIQNFNIDGFRCDMAHLVPLSFWYEARTACDALKPLYWLAECEVNDYHTVFDTTYAWEWMHTTEKWVKNLASIQDIMQVLHSYSQLPPGCTKLFFTTNHDENSWNGTEYEKYGSAAKLLAVFTASWPNGIPLVYSGQEIPNTQRLPFFDKAALHWPAQPQLHFFYQKLLQLRELAAIQNGELFLLPTENQYIMAWLLQRESNTVLIMLNFGSNDKQVLQVSHPWLMGNFTNWFSELTYRFTSNESFEIQPFEWLVYVKNG
jgi:glycosidase